MTNLVRRVNELRNKFSKQFKPKGNGLVEVEINYHNELYKLIYHDSEIVKTENLETYLSIKFDSHLPFSEAIYHKGRSYQQDFLSKMYKLFSDIDKTFQLLDVKIQSQEVVLREIGTILPCIYEAYKDYLVNLVQFYIDNPMFTYPLDCYPQTMLSDPFYEYLKKDIMLGEFNSKKKTYLYLKLIKKIIFERYLELNDDTRKEVVKNLSKFTKHESAEVVKISKIIRDKLYRYNGIKCPDHLIYISVLNEKEAQKLAEFAINKYFEEGTDTNALKLAFQGRLGIIQNDEQKKYFQNNPFFSESLIIKDQKRGYISFIFEYLKIHDYLTHDKIWHSIAKHKYFKSRKKDGKIDFVTRNEMSQSLNYKKKRLLEIKSKDKELIKLISFLEENFPQRKNLEG